MPLHFFFVRTLFEGKGLVREAEGHSCAPTARGFPGSLRSKSTGGDPLHSHLRLPPMQGP